MDDRQLALELIERLNRLIEDPDVRQLIGQLIETRVNVPASLANHPTIQINEVSDTISSYYQVGFLGILNGIVGIIHGGPRDLWGHITVRMSDENLEVLGFELTPQE